MHVGSPALTLAMLNKGQLDEFMVDKGGLHELQRSNTQSWLNVQSLQVCVCVCVCVCVYLHCDCVCERGHTLQGLVRAAAATAAHRHTRGDEEAVCLPWQLPPHLYQCVPGLTTTPGVDLQPPPH